MTAKKPVVRVPINIVEHHVHLSKEHADLLFGKDYLLNGGNHRGYFMADDVVAVVGPKGILEGLRVIGPFREKTQVEITDTDAETIRLNPTKRYSGDLEGTPGTVLVGPKGVVTLNEGVIIPAGHLHLNPDEADKLGLIGNDKVDILFKGKENLIKKDVLVRVAPNFNLKMHINSDEAQLINVHNGDFSFIIPKGEIENILVTGLEHDQIKVELVTKTSSFMAQEGIRLCTNIFEFSPKEKMRLTNNLLHAEKGELQDYYFIVAHDDEKVVGVTSVHYLPDVHMGYLEFIGIEPTYRKMGLGTFLYHKTAAYLQEHYSDIVGLILEVRSTRDGLEKRKDFFLNLGAIPIDVGFYPIGHKLDPDLMLMYKPLSPDVLLNTATIVRIFSSLAKALLK